MPLISVIVPVFNDEKYLRETVESVLMQTYEDFELILINDGSSDSSERIIDEFCKSDNRIVKINKKNEGVSRAKEEGVSVAKGEWFLFLDHDDILSPNLFETFAQYKSDADLVYAGSIGDVASKDIKDAVKNDFPCEDVDFEILSGKEAACKIIGNNTGKFKFGELWGMFISKKVIIDIVKPLISRNKETIPIVYYESVHLLYPVLFSLNKVVFLNGFYHIHRICDENLSHKNRPTSYAYDLVNAVILQREWFMENQPRNYGKQLIINYYLTLMKAWWQAFKYEKNVDVKKNITNICYNSISENLNDLSKIDKKKTIMDNINIIQIKLFRKNPRLWKIMVGDIWFWMKSI